MGESLYGRYVERTLINELLLTANPDLLDSLNQTQLKELVMHIVLLMRQINKN